MTQWINIYLDAQPVADAEEYTELLPAAEAGQLPQELDLGELVHQSTTVT